MKTSNFTLLLLLISLSFLLSLSAQMTGNFKCENSPSTCRSLVGYSSKNATTYNNIQTLFSIKKLRSILEANSLPLSTSRDDPVPPNQVLRVPIPCTCSNGTGLSNRIPVYTVKEGDTLFVIASEIYGGLVRYEKISDVNKLPDASDIKIGQRLWIPLPCSCDELDGRDVVHYAHVVRSGSSLGEIGSLFGIDNNTLARINGISGDSQLLADYPLNVPLRACSSSVRNGSLDASSTLLPNSSYVFTANNCIKCSCDASNNWTLSCEPSQLKPTRWQTCPPSQCEGAESLFIGNTTTTGSCGPRSCAYAGYSNTTILTSLTPETCPDSGGGSGPPGNYASTLSSSFGSMIVLILCALLCLCFLW